MAAEAENPIVGEYENFLYGGAEKNHYHYVSVIAKDDGSFIWRTQCNEWILTPLDKKLHFSVGAKCPYFDKGYKVMKFKTDHKGTIIGAFGPWNEYFTKVEQHSSLKYNLKGVERPKKFQNDEKEGDDTQGMIKSDTSLQWNGGKCVKNQCIGRVSIDENFVIQFNMQIHGKVCDNWESILHIGHENMHRSPGFWLHPKSYKLHARLSDTNNNNTGYDPNMELQVGKVYNIKLQSIDNAVSLFVNDKLQSFQANVFHVTRYKAPVFVADPWYTAANVTIDDLKIYAPQ